MNIITKNFGEIEFMQEKVITFKEGIPGFRELKQYIIIEDIDSPFIYLQSIENTNISFIMISPYLLMEDYSIYIKDQYVEELGGGTVEQFSVFVIATVLDSIEDATLNLVAPIIIQNDTKLGMQVILENTKYTTKNKIIELIQKGGF